MLDNNTTTGNHRNLAFINSMRRSLDSKSLLEIYHTKYSLQKRKDYLSLFTMDGQNPDKFKPFPENPKEFFKARKDPYAVSLPSKLILSCPDYNRTDEIDTNKCVNNLTKNNNKFACEGSVNNGNAIYVYYDRKRGVFRTTRGNHRTIMSFLTDGDNATIEALVFVHDENLTDEEMFMIEASSYDFDNTQKGQSKQSIFKGKLFYALNNPNSVDDQWPVELYEFLNTLYEPVGVAGTNSSALISLDGHNHVWTLMKKYKDMTNLEDPYWKVREVMNLLIRFAIPTNNKGEKEGNLITNCIVHSLGFKEYFQTVINQVDKGNASFLKQEGVISSFELFIKYIFTQRSENPLLDNLTMQTITKNASKIQEPKFYVANYCTLYNEFCKSKKLLTGNGNKDRHARPPISETTKEWNNFLSEVDISFHRAVKGQLGEIFGH